MGQDVRSPRGPRCIALVGPFQSGKTTLLEAILARTGATSRAGSVDGGTSVGDSSAEARRHKMSVALTSVTTNFMGDSYTFIDCPGSVEFAHDMRSALPAVDAAVVVCEADEKKLPQLQIILRELEELNIPRFLFLNKIDRANKRIRETLSTLQPASRIPLVLRQIPIWNGDLIEGFVDLALERAFVYREHKASEVVALEGGNLDREKEARFSMLEKLADHDDALMEQLLEDITPPRDAVFDDLARELREGQICPVLLGSAMRENGVLRLLKALRHEAPGVAETSKRLGVTASKDALAYVFKTVHLQHGGKLSFARVLAGRAPRPLLDDVLARVFGLDDPLATLAHARRRHLPGTVRRAIAGVRGAAALPGYPTLFEALVHTILGQQISAIAALETAGLGHRAAVERARDRPDRDGFRGAEPGAPKRGEPLAGHVAGRGEHPVRTALEGERTAEPPRERGAVRVGRRRADLLAENGVHECLEERGITR